MVISEISVNPWKIASKVVALNLLDEDAEGTPPEPWLYTYQMPTDLVSLRTVKVAGHSQARWSERVLPYLRASSSHGPRSINFQH